VLSLQFVRHKVDRSDICVVFGTPLSGAHRDSFSQLLRRSFLTKTHRSCVWKHRCAQSHSISVRPCPRDGLSWLLCASIVSGPPPFCVCGPPALRDSCYTPYQPPICDIATPCDDTAVHEPDRHAPAPWCRHVGGLCSSHRRGRGSACCNVLTAQIGRPYDSRIPRSFHPNN
jgi:hypothetical protein